MVKDQQRSTTPPVFRESLIFLRRPRPMVTSIQYAGRFPDVRWVGMHGQTSGIAADALPFCHFSFELLKVFIAEVSAESTQKEVKHQERMEPLVP